MLKTCCVCFQDIKISEEEIHRDGLYPGSKEDIHRNCKLQLKAIKEWPYKDSGQNTDTP